MDAIENDCKKKRVIIGIWHRTISCKCQTTTYQFRESNGIDTENQENQEREKAKLIDDPDREIRKPNYMYQWMRYYVLSFKF